MAAGLGATIAANAVYGLSGGLTDALLSVWGVAAYVGCMELLTWMRQNTGDAGEASECTRQDRIRPCT